MNPNDAMGVFSDFCIRKFKDTPIAPHLILEIVQTASKIYPNNCCSLALKYMIAL